MRTVARKYNAGRLDNKYDVGDLLAIAYNGPFKIIKFLVSVTVLLGKPTNIYVIKRPHLSYLKPFCSSD
ncbi:hypothetical protein PR048_004795, partial [Dryococelus australis]